MSAVAELERKSRPVVMLMWIVVVIAGLVMISTLASLSLHTLAVMAVLLLIWKVLLS